MSSRIEQLVDAITAQCPTRRIYGPLDSPSGYNPSNATQFSSVGRDINNKPMALYLYRGIEYSVPELAVLAGLCAATIRKRILEGWSIEDVVNKPVDAQVASARLTSRKHEWPVGSNNRYNLRELAAIANIPYNTLYDRIQAGWSLDEAMCKDDRRN